MNSKCEFFIVKLVLFMLLFVFNNVAIAQISKIKTVQEETFEQEVVAPYDSLENICKENLRKRECIQVLLQCQHLSILHWYLRIRI